MYSCPLFCLLRVLSSCSPHIVIASVLKNIKIRFPESEKKERVEVVLTLDSRAGGEDGASSLDAGGGGKGTREGNEAVHGDL